MSTDVVSFGETMLRLSPVLSTRLEDAPAFQVYVAGTESNTLACLSRLGFKTTWLSALPRSPLGRHINAELRSHGVNTDSVVWADEQTRLGIFYADEAPNPLGLQVYYDRAHSACALIDGTAIDFSLVERARILHLTGITPALSVGTRDVFARFLQKAQTKNIPLSFDVNYRAKLWSATDAATQLEEACQQAAVLFCTSADAAELWGFVGDPEAVLQQVARKFGTNDTSKTLVLTLGNKGAAELHNNTYSIEAAFPTEGGARFGSGDAFAAGYLYAYLEGALYRELRDTSGVTPLAFGNAVAALKRCVTGDIATITPTEVKSLLQKRDEKRFR